MTPSFINRELSWLEFNQRVLQEAQDPDQPLLERLKFLAITASNLDEFFMVRVGSLQQLLEQDNNRTNPAGLTTEEQLAKISWRTHALVADQAAVLQELTPRLAEQGVRVLAPGQLSPNQVQYVEQTFTHGVYPLLTPLAVPTPDAFPLLPGLTLCLAVRLAPTRPRGKGKGRTKARWVVVPIPKNLSRFIPLESERGATFIMLEDVVRTHLDQVFPGEVVEEAALFRLTRNADMVVREDLAGDLLAQMRRVLVQRRASACVRLELSTAASPAMRALLKASLDVQARDIYEIDGPLGLDLFFSLGMTAGLDALRDKPWVPQPAPALRPADSLFAVLSRQDLLLCHPYESFEPVQRLIEEAADDPDVLAIKQILYRTSRQSPLIAALARAAERGKQVTAIVELKARFDEARNIEWAKALERSGVQVIYGIKGLKTHAKLAMVIRREPTGIRRYLHFGTGNYNEITARLYTDVSLMTSNEDLAADASLFFNTITGYSQPVKYRKIEAAPLGLRDRLLELIAGETARARAGQPARILAKMNSLVDTQLIEALYEASQAGVDILLNVRGTCCLRAGVPGLSASIRVVSIVDRFLEHSRVLCFHHGGTPLVFISSADWMPRNLDRRIELLVPVEAPACQARLIALLETCARDTVKGRWLRPDDTYERRPAEAGERGRSQALLCREARAAAEAAVAAQQQVFEPHRPAAAGT